MRPRTWRATGVAMLGLAALTLTASVAEAAKRTQPRDANASAAGCAIAVGDSVLLVRDTVSGKWSVPAGKVESDDKSPRLTARRETLEEARVSVETPEEGDIIHVLDTGFVLYRCHPSSLDEKLEIDPKEIFDTDRVAWFDAADLLLVSDDALRFPPERQLLLRLLGTGRDDEKWLAFADLWRQVDAGFRKMEAERFGAGWLRNGNAMEAAETRDALRQVREEVLSGKLENAQTALARATEHMVRIAPTGPRFEVHLMNNPGGVLLTRYSCTELIGHVAGSARPLALTSGQTERCESNPFQKSTHWTLRTAPISLHGRIVLPKAPAGVFVNVALASLGASITSAGEGQSNAGTYAPLSVLGGVDYLAHTQNQNRPDFSLMLGGGVMVVELNGTSRVKPTFGIQIGIPLLSTGTKGGLVDTKSIKALNTAATNAAPTPETP